MDGPGNLDNFDSLSFSFYNEHIKLGKFFFILLANNLSDSAFIFQNHYFLPYFKWSAWRHLWISPNFHLSAQNVESEEETGFESSSLSVTTSQILDETSATTTKPIMTSQKPFQIFYSIFLPHDISVEREKNEFVVRQNKKKVNKGNLRKLIQIFFYWNFFKCQIECGLNFFCPLNFIVRKNV